MLSVQVAFVLMFHLLRECATGGRRSGGDLEPRSMRSLAILWYARSPAAAYSSLAASKRLSRSPADSRKFLVIVSYAEAALTAHSLQCRYSSRSSASSPSLPTEARSSTSSPSASLSPSSSLTPPAPATCSAPCPLPPACSASRRRAAPPLRPDAAAGGCQRARRESAKSWPPRHSLQHAPPSPYLHL